MPRRGRTERSGVRDPKRHARPEPYGAPHDDRHRTNGTPHERHRVSLVSKQAAIPAPQKKSSPVPDYAEQAFEPMFSGVRHIFGIIYPGFCGMRAAALHSGLYRTQNMVPLRLNTLRVVPSITQRQPRLAVSEPASTPSVPVMPPVARRTT